MAEFSLDRELFQAMYRENETHILCSTPFFPRNALRLWERVEKYGKATQVTDDNITRRMRIACLIPEAKNTYFTTSLMRTHLNIALSVYFCLLLLLYSYS
jgi:hypothetical protein